MEKSLNRGYIVRFELSSGFRQQKFMLICKKFMGMVPASVFTEKNVATVKTLIEEDAHFTVQEIEELSGNHLSRFLKILRERLGLRKICACWVHHLLTDEQKQSGVRLASQVIEKYDKCDPRRLEEMVTGDENWI